MATLNQFTDEAEITFALVSDSRKEIKRAYGRGRVTYLIDKQGTIRFIQEGVPNNDEFIEQLKKLQ